MSDFEVQNEMINKLSSALSPDLGVPADIIERALKRAFKKVSEENNNNNALDNSSLSSPTTPTTPSLPTNVHNDIQVSEPVDELSRDITFKSPDSNHNSHLDHDFKNQEISSQSFKPNRKDSLSSLIEITQSGSASINIKLPNLYASQKESKSNNRNIKSTNSADENLSLSRSTLLSDEQNIYNMSNNMSNNQNLMQNRQMNSIHNDPNYTEYIPPQQRESFDIHNDSNYTEYIPPQQRESFNIQTDHKSFTNENRQIDPEYIPQRRDSQVKDTYDSFNPETYVSNQRHQGESFVNQDSDFESVPPSSEDYRQHANDEHKPVSDSSHAYNSQAYNSHRQPRARNNPSEMYRSEWPTLSESTKKGDSRKNPEVDLGAWGQMDLNISSAWGKNKKWSSEIETKKPEPQPPTNTWNPDDVNKLTWKPIQEPKAPIHFKKKKATPANFELDDSDGWGAPPTKYTPWEDDEKQGYCFDLIQEQRETVFWTKQNDVWVNVSEEVKITQEKRIVERTADGVNHRDVRQTRTQTQRIGRQGIESKREQIENGNENIMIHLSDDENDSQSNSARSVSVSRERLGNPRWKTEEEWLAHNSISSEERSTSDKDDNEFNDETSNWDDYPLTTEGSADNEVIKDDAWFSEQEDIIKEPEQNQLLINVDSNSDNITSESTIINTHPPIYHGTINNAMENSNDFIFDYANPANTTANVDIINNELNLLSFDDYEDNKVSNSSDNVTSIERPHQENGYTYNFDEFEDFLEKNRAMFNGDNNKRSGTQMYNDNSLSPNRENELLTNDSNELQPVPYTITDNYERSHYTTSFNNSSADTSPPKSYYCEDSSQPNIESTISSSTFNVEGRDDERRPYITNNYESSHYKSFNSPIDTSLSKSYYCEDSSQPNTDSITSTLALDVNGKDDEGKNSNNELKSDPTKSDYIINLTIETTSHGRQILRLRIDDDPEHATAEFCQKWDMINYEDALKGLVQKEKRKRLRKRKTKCKLTTKSET